MLHPIKMCSYERRVRQLHATHLERPFQEMDLYLERKMREYTVKHFKKIWCIEYAVRGLKMNMENFEESKKLKKECKDERPCDALLNVKRLKYGDNEKDEIVRNYVRQTPRSCKYHEVISPIYKSPRPIHNGRRPIGFTDHICSSSVSNEFLEVLRLDDPEASINIEPLTAIMGTQKKDITTDKNVEEHPKADDLQVYSAQEDTWTDKESADLIVLGPHGTTASAEFMMSLDWSTGSQVTRKLLAHIFDRETLASHTLTGKPSPAFKDREMPDKKPLDPKKVADIVHAVTMYANCTAREVRMAITTKCADENKMLRNKSRTNKENLSPASGKSGKSYSKKND